MFPMIPLYPVIPNLLKLGISHDEPPTIYSLLNSYVNFSKEEPVKISDLAKTGRAMFFDFDYPLTSVIDKADFETMILNHYLMRRIGYETVTAFKIALNVKLNEIMPMYNKLFESIQNWDLFNDGETVKRITKDDRISSSTTNTTNSNTSDRRYSNTPQNQIEDVKNGSYVSEYNYDKDNGQATGNSNILDTIQNVDLLIIDDLGTETVKSMKFTELFNIINTRLLNTNKKPLKTIISTNLSLQNLFATYDEIIFSRFVGHYNICRFFGDDIRFKIKR